MVTEVGNPNRKQVNMKQITDAEFIEAMTKAVEERGAEYVYPKTDKVYGVCQYTIDGKGACLIGKAIEVATGVPYDGMNDSANNVLSLYGVSDDVRHAAQLAQSVQDDGEPWGTALSEFRRVLETGAW